jgi:signal peptidase II
MNKLWLLLAVPIIALDQWVKWWAVEHLKFQASRPFVPGVDLVYAENTGASFSLFAGGGARWFLVVASTIAAAGIILAVCKRWIAGLPSVIAISCVLGGAGGNLIDRAAQGYVVDMFRFTFIDFAIFNTADVFITCGGVAFCVCMLLEGRKAAAKNNTEGTIERK